MARTVQILAFTILMIAFGFGKAEAQPKKTKATPGVASPAVSSAPASETRPTFREPEAEAHRVSNFKWDAFIDVEARIPNKDTLADRGVTLNDAALIMSKDFGRAKAFVGLPFSSTLSSGTNDFKFAADQAEAYFQLEKWSPLLLRFGQYETFLGVEPNHSRDRFIADMGAVKTYLLPKTHTGAQVGYIVQALTLRAQIANPNGATAMANQNPELGFSSRFDGGPGYGALSATYNEGKSTGGGQTSNLIFELKGGLVAEKLHFDGEVVVRKWAGYDKTANGFGAFAAYPIDDALALGGRFEYLKDAYITRNNTGVAVDSVTTFAFGPSYKLQQDLTVRGDFSLATEKAGSASEETILGVTVSLVADL